MRKLSLYFISFYEHERCIHTKINVFVLHKDFSFHLIVVSKMRCSFENDFARSHHFALKPPRISRVLYSHQYLAFVRSYRSDFLLTFHHHQFLLFIIPSLSLFYDWLWGQGKEEGLDDVQWILCNILRSLSRDFIFTRSYKSLNFYTINA